MSEKSQKIEQFIERTKVTKELSFSFNKLQDIFGEQNVPDISWNDIRPYSSELREIEKIDFANILGTKLNYEKIPEEFFRYKQLNTLNLAFQNIKNVPAKIQQLNNLRVINLAGNKLSQFPESITALPNLKEVRLRKNNWVFSDVFWQVEREQTSYQEPLTDPNEVFMEQIYTQIGNFYRKKPDYLAEKLYPWGLKIEKKNYRLYFYLDSGIYDRFFLNICVAIAGKPNSIPVKLTLLDEINQVFSLIPQITTLYYILSEEELNPEDCVSFPEIVKHYKEGRLSVKNTNYAVYDIIMNLGGQQLLDKLEKEKQQENEQARLFFSEKRTIQSVEIKNFKLFSQLAVKLSERVNVVIGKNGFGKTSLLQAIALGLAPIEHHEDEAGREAYNYKNLINKDIRLRNNRYEQFAQITVNWEKFRQSYKIYPQTLTLNQNSKTLPTNYLVLAYGANLFSDEKFSYKKIAEEIIHENGKHFSIYSILEDYTRSFYNPLLVLDSLMLYVPQEKITATFEKIEILVKTLNQFLDIEDVDTYRIEKNTTDNSLYKKGSYYFVNSKGKWELHELSEGYRKNILLMTDILLRIIAAKNSLLPENPINDVFTQVKGVVLIDEYDKHLHPAWQRQLIFQIKKILPRIQFVLTTHNAFSLQSAVGENVIILDEAKTQYDVNKVEAESVLSIIREYFTKALYDKDTQNKLTNLSAKIREADKGNTQAVYSDDFKALVKDLLDKSEEINSITSSFILELNEILQNQKQPSFAL